MKQPINTTCRMCCKAKHTHTHTHTHTHKECIVMGCTTLPPSEYTNRHNKVAGYIHWMICKLMGLQYYENIPERAINVKSATFMWDVPDITGRTVLTNQLIWCCTIKKGKTCLLLDIAIPDDSYFNTKKLKNLAVTKTWKSRPAESDEDKKCASFN